MFSIDFTPGKWLLLLMDQAMYVNWMTANFWNEALYVGRFGSNFAPHP